MDGQILNEFRQDLVSGDWVLFSTGRKHSIREFEKFYQSKEDCPFEDFQRSGQEIIEVLPGGITAIKNKYPALLPGACGPDVQVGPFRTHDAVGDHRVLVFNDHELRFVDFSKEQMVDVIRAYKKMYQDMASASDCVEYVMVFHNHGREAGASIYHSHSQIISLPILPPDVSRSIYGSLNFYKENKKKVYDIIIDWERSENKRIVYENDFFIAFCPFVSKTPYEVRIFSKDSHAHFEKMPDELDKYLADVLSTVLKKINKALKNPPYNFFIHTAPVKEKYGDFHEFYHWHVEVLPKLSISAGFELGTGVDINVIDPEMAAEELRNA